MEPPEARQFLQEPAPVDEPLTSHSISGDPPPPLRDPLPVLPLELSSSASLGEGD